MKRYYGGEEEAFMLVEGYLRSLCENNWHAMEFDDRYSELCLLFVYAWRQLPTNTGHFLRDFEAVCRPHMDKLNRIAAARRYRKRSMDAMVVHEKNTKCTGISLYHFLSSKDDATRLQVKEFMQSLIGEDREIVRALLRGETKVSIARRHGLTAYQFMHRVRAIGTRYITQYHI